MYNELIDKGYASLRRGSPETARIYFQQAIDTDSSRPQGYFALAQTYLEVDDQREQVRTALETALQVDPTYAPARAFLAIELLKNYDIEGAEDELERALKDDPANLLVHIKYAEYYYRLGFYNRAVELLERGLHSPHGANEHVVALARSFLTQCRQKSNNIILREPPDPRRLLLLFQRLWPFKKAVQLHS